MRVSRISRRRPAPAPQGRAAELEERFAEWVWNHHDGVEVRGWYDGSLGGSVYRTWTTYRFACPTLHWPGS